jgi:hypothetical protein
MNEAQKKAYASKYFRTGAEVRLPKEENPYPQMKYDSVRLQSTPDFGNLNTASYWQYICAPLAMPPEPKRNDRGRYLTLMGRRHAQRAQSRGNRRDHDRARRG